jgi:hypothetical protein
MRLSAERRNRPGDPGMARREPTGNGADRHPRRPGRHGPPARQARADGDPEGPDGRGGRADDRDATHADAW